MKVGKLMRRINAVFFLSPLHSQVRAKDAYIEDGIFQVVLVAFLIVSASVYLPFSTLNVSTLHHNSNTASVVEDRIVVNGGFESGILTAWRNATEVFPDGEYSITKETVFDGHYSLKMTTPDIPPCKAYVWQHWRPDEGFEDMVERDVELKRNFTLNFAVYFEEGVRNAELVVRLDIYYHNTSRSMGSRTFMEYVVGTGDRPTMPYHRELGIAT